MRLRAADLDRCRIPTNPRNIARWRRGRPCRSRTSRRPRGTPAEISSSREQPTTTAPTLPAVRPCGQQAAVVVTDELRREEIGEAGRNHGEAAAIGMMRRATEPTCDVIDPDQGVVQIRGVR